MIQLYNTDLEVKKSVKSEHSMTITHKPTKLSVSGKGEHEYQLRCKLMTELGEKVGEYVRKEEERDNGSEVDRGTAKVPARR